MHIFPSGMIGILVAIGVIVDAADTLVAVLYSPFVVCGTAMTLMLLPFRQRS